MPELKFNATAVKLLCEHALAAKEWRGTYEDATGPALHLAGDHGVYLMSNGLPGLMKPAKNGDAPGNIVVYAEGINPDVDEDWWETKRAVFGGDDGVEELAWCEKILRSLTVHPNQTHITIVLNADEISMELLAA